MSLYAKAVAEMGLGKGVDNVHTLGFTLGGAELESARILHVFVVPP